MEPHGFTELGGIEKKEDPRDIELGTAAPVVYTFPLNLRNEKAWALPIEYQGQQPACGAHAGSEMKELRLGKRMSPRFTWADLKTFDGWPIDSGTDLRSIFKSITGTGAVDFDVYGNDASLSLQEYAKAPASALRTLAGKNAGDGYGFITDHSWYGLKQFIADHGPTIILLRVGNEWWTAPNGQSSWAEADILPLRTPKSIVSGHFVLAHSYDNDHIYFLNHWSDGWGRKGHGYFGKEYMPFVNDAGALFPLAFQKDLVGGMTDPDVKELQKYLNAHGYTVAQSGPGSPGYETTYFGPATQIALQKLQKQAGLASSGTPYTTGYGRLGKLTRAWIQTHP